MSKGRIVLLILGVLFLGGCFRSVDVTPTPEKAKELVRLRGFNFNEKGFLAAVGASDVFAVNAFLAAGMNVNARDDSEGDTALMLAAASGDLPMVNALLKGGADINAKNKKDRSALARAFAYQHEDVVDVLLANPTIDLNAPGPGGATPLIIYVIRDAEAMVVRLLDRGANVTLQDDDGDTALHSAVVSGNVKILRLLLVKGANPNARNKLGGTPLMWTGTFGRDEIAQILLENGADPRAKDNEGKTSAYWAGRNGHDELAKKLREAEKK